MMQLIIIFFMMMNSFLFMQMKHPMSMGIILLIQTLFSCVYTGIMTKSFWFSYILFLIFIGGMLILFIYMSSLASNEKIMFSYSFFIKMLMFMNFLMLIMMIDKFYMINFFNNTEMIKFNPLMLIKENYFSLSKMYDSPNNLIIILLISYLLLTLIVIVKITFKFNGPLRPKYY